MSRTAGKPRTDSNHKRTVNLVRFQPIHDIAAARPHLPAEAANETSRRGRRALYPDWVLLLLLVAERVYGSRSELCRVLGDTDRNGRHMLWGDIRDTAIEVGYDPLLPTPPTVDHMKAFAVKYLGDYVPGSDGPALTPEDPRSEAQDGPITRMRSAFRKSMIALAQDLGNLQPAGHDDHEFDQRSLIYGDGTFIHRQTSTDIVEDRLTGELHVLGGVTSNPRSARVQPVISNAAIDGKKAAGHDGINMVFIGTMTRFGEVVLDVDASLGAEAVTATRLIGDIANDADGCIRAATWDGALTGWMPTSLHAEHGIHVINYVPVSSRVSGKDIQAEATKEVDNQYGSTVNRFERRHIENQREVARRRITRERYRGTVLPLGLSLRDNNRSSRIEIVDSRHYKMRDHTHTNADGTACTHPLYVDDGALFDVDAVTGKKAQRLTLTRLVGQRRADRYVSRSTWSLECAGNTIYVNVTHDISAGTRADSLTEEQKAIQDLRVVHYLDKDQWSQLYVTPRNCSESGNNWRKACLLRGSKVGHRASSLQYNHQRLDMIALGILRSSLTWVEAQKAAPTNKGLPASTGA